MNKLIPLSLMGVATIMAIMPNKTKTEEKKVESKNEVQILSSKSTIRVKADIEENTQPSVEQEKNIEEMHNEIGNTVQNSYKTHNETENIVQNSYETRMTSYYADDGYGTGDTTASGLSPVNFETNENGWYTYNGKLVIATASTRLGYTDMRTYTLYDELTLNIDGTDYDAVVLDVCGACMRHNRIDLFVSGSWAVKDTIITVKE